MIVSCSDSPTSVPIANEKYYPIFYYNKIDELASKIDQYRNEKGYRALTYKKNVGYTTGGEEPNGFHINTSVIVDDQFKYDQIFVSKEPDSSEVIISRNIIYINGTDNIVEKLFVELQKQSTSYLFSDILANYDITYSLNLVERKNLLPEYDYLGERYEYFKYDAIDVYIYEHWIPFKE